MNDKIKYAIECYEKIAGRGNFGPKHFSLPLPLITPPIKRFIVFV